MKLIMEIKWPHNDRLQSARCSYPFLTESKLDTAIQDLISEMRTSQFVEGFEANIKLVNDE